MSWDSFTNNLKDSTRKASDWIYEDHQREFRADHRTKAYERVGTIDTVNIRDHMGDVYLRDIYSEKTKLGQDAKKTELFLKLQEDVDVFRAMLTGL